MKCSCCNFNENSALSILDNGNERYAFCPSHLLLYFLGSAQPRESGKSTIDNTIRCPLCGKPSIYLKDWNTEYYLCSEHTALLVKRQLKSEDFKTLHTLFGDTFLIQGNFKTKKADTSDKSAW